MDAVKTTAGDAETRLTETGGGGQIGALGSQYPASDTLARPLVRLLLQFCNPLIYMLLGAAIAPASWAIEWTPE